MMDMGCISANIKRTLAESSGRSSGEMEYQILFTLEIIVVF